MPPKGDGPFKVLECINENAYKLDVPSEYGVSATFNVSDFSLFLADDEFDLRTNPFQKETNDMNMQAVQGSSSSSVDQVKVPIDPIARVRAKRFKDSLHALVRTIQEKVGTHKSIKGLELDGMMFKPLVQVEEIPSGSESDR